MSGLPGWRMCSSPRPGSMVTVSVRTVTSRRRLAMTTSTVRRNGGRNLTVVNPSREFEDIYERMGQLMNLAFGLAPTDLGDMPWSPLADLSETDNAYVIKADLPGVNKDQVDIQ